MVELIYQWIDLVWLPIGWFSVHKGQRLKALAFIVTCILIMRTQVELIDSTGFSSGFLPFLTAPAYTRGLLVYSIAISIFLILAHYSPRTRDIVFFAAALTMFFSAFIISMIVMVL